jgi:hypothetical protein
MTPHTPVEMTARERVDAVADLLALALARRQQRSQSRHGETVDDALTLSLMRSNA